MKVPYCCNALVYDKHYNCKSYHIYGTASDNENITEVVKSHISKIFPCNSGKISDVCITDPIIGYENMRLHGISPRFSYSCKVSFKSADTGETRCIRYKNESALIHDNRTEYDPTYKEFISCMVHHLALYKSTYDTFSINATGCKVKLTDKFVDKIYYADNFNKVIISDVSVSDDFVVSDGYGKILGVDEL